MSFEQTFLSSSSFDKLLRFILQHPEPIIPFSSFIMVEPMISPAWSATSQKFTTIDTGERGL